MTYEEALAAFDSCSRFGGEPGLSRIRALLAELGDPQDGLKFVHAAGTNGKGTVCTLTASVLSAAGYRTGLYLSPHVCDFRERMQLGGTMISRADLAEAAELAFRAAEKRKERGVQPNEFEMITAAAMLWFRKMRCEAVVLETGLGGRFDATNVIRSPLVSVITSVSLDHTKILGNTVEQIAAEKSGIFKPGCPAVCGPGIPAGALRVLRDAASRLAAPLTEASRDGFTVLKADLSGTRFRTADGLELFLPFAGEHQLRNAASVLSAVGILRREGFSIPPEAVRSGFAAARLPARTEVLSEHPLVLLDGAHNPEGTAALAALLEKYLPGRRASAVMGMMADKDAVRAVGNLSGAFSRVFTAAPPSERAMSAEELCGLWRSAGVPAEACGDPLSALKRALSSLEPDGALVICGSFYLAGELRGPALELLKKTEK